MRAVLAFVFLFVPFFAFSQDSLEGSLRDDTNEPLYIQDEVSDLSLSQKAYREYIGTFEDKVTNETVGQIFTGFFGLSPYHTNYLMPVVFDKTYHDGRKRVETQFQISFKKDMFKNLLNLNEHYAFAYSQTSWWQTSQNSSPFRESNYRPEFFVYGFYGERDFPLKGYQFGILHESNGQDKESSRSWNRVYLSTFWKVGNVFLAPRVWYRIPEHEKSSPDDYDGDDNPDIEDYLGYGDLSVVYPWRKNVFKAKWRNNLKFSSKNRGALELEWTFPLWSDNWLGYINYFTGYGASLLDYNEHNDKIGIGFALSR